jgi:hypothetical protein
MMIAANSILTAFSFDNHSRSRYNASQRVGSLHDLRPVGVVAAGHHHYGTVPTRRSRHIPSETFPFSFIVARALCSEQYDAPARATGAPQNRGGSPIGHTQPS